MFRSAINFAKMGALATIPVLGLTACDASWPFDTRGLPTHNKLVATPKVKDATGPLALAGVGMRSKNFYITAVDVYLCGCSLSGESVQRAQAWKAAGSTSSLPEALLAPAGSKGKAGPKVAVALKFVRAVSTSQVVEAFNDAFKGLPADEVAKFKAALAATVGDAGLKVGEEIGFYWLNPNGLVITKNGDVGDVLVNDDLCLRLLGVYLDPKITICPELLASVDTNVQSLDPK
jgi:hypothetical protein